MNNTINSSPVNRGNLSFGRLAPDVKEMLKNPEVSRVVGKVLSEKNLGILDKSKLKFSLSLRFTNPDTLEIDGLFLSPPKSLPLSQVKITPDKQVENGDILAICLKKALPLVKAHFKILKEVNRHNWRKAQSIKIHHLEEKVRAALNTYDFTSNNSQNHFADELEQIQGEIRLEKIKRDEGKIRNKWEFGEKTRRAWEGINPETFAKFA